MTSRKRTIITIETRQRTVARRSGGKTIAWCERCRGEVLMLKPGEVAAFVRITAGDFFRRVETGDLHFLETENGALLICRNLPADESSDSKERMTW